MVMKVKRTLKRPVYQPMMLTILLLGIEVGWAIPGYYLQTPSGSIADVFSSSNISTAKINTANFSGYKVLLSRNLNTGNNDDVVFNTTDGNSYTVSILLTNGDSLNYVGTNNQQLIFKKTWNEK